MTFNEPFNGRCVYLSGSAGDFDVRGENRSTSSFLFDFACHAVKLPCNYSLIQKISILPICILRTVVERQNALGRQKKMQLYNVKDTDDSDFLHL